MSKRTFDEICGNNCLVNNKECVFYLQKNNVKSKIGCISKGRNDIYIIPINIDYNQINIYLFCFPLPLSCS